MVCFFDVGIQTWIIFLVGEEHFYFGADVVDNPYPRLNFETILPANYEFISHKKKLK